MNTLSRTMLSLIQNNLQIGEESPSYIIYLKKPEEFELLPSSFTFPDGAIVSIETSSTKEFGCASATIVVENCYGLKSPEFAPSKHPEDDDVIKNSQSNYRQREYYRLFWPETWIQICLGYGNLTVPVITGAIDSCEINSKDAKLTIQLRDNMRYLVDQYIDPMTFGKELVYPRTDDLVVLGDGAKSLTVSRDMGLVKIKGLQTYLNVRTSNSLNATICGKVYNGQTFQFIEEGLDDRGKKWYKIKFNNEDRWIFSEFADIIHTNEIIKKASYVKVDKISNTTGSHLHVRSGPGVANPEVGEVQFGDILDYIDSQIIGDVRWYHISYTENGSSVNGWVCGNYASIENSSPAEQVKDYHNHIHVKESADSNSADVGLIYDGNAYTYVSSQLVGDVYWHNIKFKHDDGTEKTGWVLDSETSLEQLGETLSYHTIAQVTNVTTHLHIRPTPSTRLQEVAEVFNGQNLQYLGTVSEESIDGSATSGLLWHHIMFTDKSGSRAHGYIRSDYSILKPGYQITYQNNPDETDLGNDYYVDLTQTVNPQVEKWTASAIVQDLTTMATYIGGRGGPPKLDRQICNVMTSEINLLDPSTGAESKYVVQEKKFPYNTSYFDSAMVLVNSLGNVDFRCVKYGDIVLHRSKILNQSSMPDWDFYDYIDITEAGLKYNIQDIRNRVMIINEKGPAAVFEHTGLAWGECKGVNRSFGMKVGEGLKTIDQMKEAARSAFQQLLYGWRKMTIAVPGNPMLDLGDCAKVHDMVTTASMVYRIREIRHIFTTDGGFITQLELDFVNNVDIEEIILLSDNIPAYTKRYRHHLELSGEKNVAMKFPSTVLKVNVLIKDINTSEVLANIEVKGDVIEGSAVNGGLDLTNPPTPETIKYIKIQRTDVRLRTSPDTTINTNIKKLVSAGHTLKYLEETDEWYKGIDTDGEEVFVHKTLATTYEQTGSTDSSLTQASGSIQQFLQLVQSKVGTGYVYGTQGETLTSELLSRLENTFGYSHYHFTDNGVQVNANKWLGSQVFDCSGLIVWALQKMSILSSNQDYSAHGLFSELCYEIKESDLKPGDLIFRQGRGGIYHVGVAIDAFTVVEARGTAYGVIQRGIFKAEKYGRLKKLDSTEVYTATDINSSPITIPKVASSVPTKYTILSNFQNDIVPQEMRDKVQILNGNLLFYKDNCVLYNIGVRSNGGEKNELVFQWTTTSQKPVPLTLDYEVLVY